MSKELAPSSRACPSCPESLYGRLKCESESFVLKEYAESIVIRICLVYGSKLGERQGFLSWILNSLEQGKPVTLFTDEWRTPVYEDDISEAIARLISLWQADSRDRASLPIHERIFHVPGPERISRYQFGEKLLKYVDAPSSLLVGGRHRDAPFS